MENFVSLVVEELYGANPSIVARAMVGHDWMQLATIQNQSGLDLIEIRNCLVVLIQQNIVESRAFNVSAYRLVTSAVLARSRFPRYLYVINERFGDLAGAIVEEVLEHGNISLEQIMPKVACERIDPKATEQMTNKLVGLGYLVDGSEEEAKTAPVVIPAKRRASTRAKKAPVKRAKLENPASAPSADNEEEGMPIRYIPLDGNTYYRFNFKKLNNEFKSEIVGDLVGNRLNNHCKIIIETMFKLGYDRPHADIDILKNLPERPRMDKSTLNRSLNLLVSDQSEFLTSMEDDIYAINYAKISAQLQMLTIEKIIENTYGSYHGRIFRMICTKGSIDEKTLTGLSLLPAQEARAALNQLFAAKFVVGNELPGSKEMIYTVRLQDISQMMQQSTLQSMYNLKIRIKAELDKAYEKFQRYNLLNDKDRQKLDRYKITESRIEIALNELDKTLMILSEF